MGPPATVRQGAQGIQQGAGKFRPCCSMHWPRATQQSPTLILHKGFRDRGFANASRDLMKNALRATGLSLFPSGL